MTHPGRARGDAGSLPLAMLLVIVCGSLAALLLPLALGQLQNTGRASLRLQALNAAQSGLNIALARIRDAADTSGQGDVTRLPCAASSTGGNGTGRYAVTVVYRPAKGSAAVLPCPMAAGAQPPGYADFVARGWDDSGRVARQLKAGYRFGSAITENIPGGAIRSADGTGSCLDTGVADPPAGSPVKVLPCRAGRAGQQFVYNGALNLVTVTPSHPGGLCLQAAPTAGTTVRLQPCRTPPAFDQQWSLNNVRAFEGTSDGVGTNGLCMAVRNGELVLVQDTPGSASPCRQPDATYFPDATVGAGAAGADTDQLVNYGEFGRCLDLDNFQVHRNLLVYPCKQAPDAGGVAWNQKFYLPAGGTGVIHLFAQSDGGRRYCVVAPAGGQTDVRINVALCPSGTPPPTMTWTIRPSTASLAERYRIEDAYGRCLSSSDQVGPGESHYAVVAACGSDKIQKWNAAPAMLTAALTDIAER